MSEKSGRRVDVYEAVFAALSSAARRRVLITIYFNGGSMTAGEIAATFESAWPTTTRHLQVLEAAGLLAHEKKGRTRIYRIQTKRLELVRDWLAHFSCAASTREKKHASERNQEKRSTRNGRKDRST